MTASAPMSACAASAGLHGPGYAANVAARGREPMVVVFRLVYLCAVLGLVTYGILARIDEGFAVFG
jgi:hypothetical protein